MEDMSRLLQRLRSLAMAVLPYSKHVPFLILAGVVNSILHNVCTWQALLLILILKIIATALCSGSETVGGLFTPTLFVGAALGAPYGHILVGLSSLSDTIISGYVLIGIEAFLASARYAPLMCILMIFEMTLSYEVVLPLMWASMIDHHTAHQRRAKERDHSRINSHFYSQLRLRNFHKK